ARDGTIQIAISLADCMNDVVAWTTLGDRAVVDRSSITEGAPFAIYADLALAGDCWYRAGGTWQRIPAVPEHDGIVPVPGPIPTVIDGHDAYRVRAGGARRLPVFVDGAPKAVDAAGRIWSIADGELRIAHRAPPATSACDHDP